MRKLLLICVAIIATMLYAVPTANASYGSVLPEGLTKSPRAAKDRINKLMDIDHGVRQAVAENHRIPALSLMGAKVSSIKRSSAVLGSSRDGSNSARASSGSIVPTSYKAGQKVFSWTVTLQLRDGRTVTDKWKWDCSNPLLKTTSPPPLRIVTKVKTFKIRYFKKKVVTRWAKCPGASRFRVRVPIVIRGTTRVRVLTKAVHLVKRKIRAKTNFRVTARIDIRCGKAPKIEVPPQIKCVAGQVIGSNGNCVSQEIRQDCEAGTIRDSSNQCVAINVVCGNVNLGDGDIDQGGNCNSSPPPPPPSQPKVSAECTNLEVEPNLAVARGIRATVTYTAQNTTLTSVMFNWGDGATSVGSSVTVRHQYAEQGTYVVYATLTFKDVSGKVTSVTCASTTVTAKDGTEGSGTGTPGQPGGPGAGGEPGTGDGPKCRATKDAIINGKAVKKGDLIDGKADQFGYCE